MGEKPKEETIADKKPCKTPKIGDESSWGEDIKEHDYYYDDAHGYEVFEPDEDDDTEASSKKGRM